MNKSIKELLTLHFLNDGVRSTFLILLPFIAKDLHLSLTLSGFLGSSLALSSALLAFPSGFIVAKLGGFKLITILLIVYSIGSILIGLSPSITFLLLAFLLGSFGFGMFHSASFTIVAKNSSEKNIGRNMGDFTAIGDIGRSAIPPAAVFLTAIIGWRFTIQLIGLIGFICYFVFNFLKVKDVNIAQTIEESKTDFIKEIINLLKTKDLLLTSASAILDSIAGSPVYIFLPFLFLLKKATTSELGILMFAFFIGSFLGKVILGRAIDKLGDIKVFTVSEIFMAFCLIILALSSNFFLLLILSLLLGVFTKGTSPIVQTMFSRHSHKNHYNKLFGISETCIAFSAFLAQVLMGVAADRFGILFIFYFCAIFAALATIPVLLSSKSRVEQKELIKTYEVE